MTEQEYINVRDLERISTAIHALSNVIPEISDAVPLNEHKEIIVKLRSWEQVLYNRIKTNNNS